VPAQLPPVGPEQVHALHARLSEKVVYRAVGPTGYAAGQVGNGCPSPTTWNTHTCDAKGGVGVATQTCFASPHIPVSALVAVHKRASFCHCAGGGVWAATVGVQVPPVGLGAVALIVPLLPVQPETGPQAGAAEVLMHLVPQPKSPNKLTAVAPAQSCPLGAQVQAHFGADPERSA